MQLDLEPELVDRFAADLDALVAPGEKVGLAVSGGPDSIALLLLASAARPDRVEAATVDHALRAWSASEAAGVAEFCAKIGVPHQVLTAEWASPPRTSIQERAREERYRLLGRWMLSRSIDALATGHHADDQAETLLMRLNRGAGVRGLAAMRPVSVVPGTELPLVRPLLGWRRSELEQVCMEAGAPTVSDPSNRDEQFERVQVRRILADLDWLDGAMLERSASHLAEADAALDWAAAKVWAETVTEQSGALLFKPEGVPRELLRRTVASAVARLATEGEAGRLRGRELDQLLAALGSGATATLRGVRCSGGDVWTFEPAPPRS